MGKKGEFGAIVLAGTALNATDYLPLSSHPTFFFPPSITTCTQGRSDYKAVRRGVVNNKGTNVTQGPDRAFTISNKIVKTCTQGRSDYKVVRRGVINSKGTKVTQSADGAFTISNRVFYKVLKEGTYKIINVNIILLT